MRWKSLFVAICFCVLGALSWAQELPSPQVTSSLEVIETSPSVSQRLRVIAEHLQAATNDSQDDLEILLAESTQVLNELTLLQTEASASESEAASMKALYESCYNSRMNLITKMEHLEKWNKRWKIVSGALTVLSAILLLL